MRAVPTLQVDNARIRVTEWRFAPGAQTGPHVHEMEYVVIPLVSGKLRIVDDDGVEAYGELVHGDSYARPAGISHNVININDFEIAFVEVELKDSPTR